MSLVAVFMEQARAVALGTERYSTISPKDLLKIATNPAMRAEFQREFTGANDPDFRLQIEQFVLDLADSLEEDSQKADRKVDLLDRAGMGIAASVTATGIGATAAAFFTGATAGSLLGPIGTLAGGLVAAAAGRHTLKTRSDESKSAAQTAAPDRTWLNDSYRDNAMCWVYLRALVHRARALDRLSR